MERKKSLIEILLIPLVIAAVGLVGTYSLTHEQINSAERLARSDQQIKLLEIFSEKITSEKIIDREYAVRILKMFDSELSEKLASVVIESNNEDTLIKKIANDILQKKAYVVIGSYNKFNDALIFKEKQINNVPYAIKIYLTEKKIYAVTMGGDISYQIAIKILNHAKSTGAFKDAYIMTSDNWVWQD
ncbi:MAG TPA: hypothetical protein VFG10_04750 [Saprospiraceae bacterium]|nr:hypothetical protein [Saprospiraceae bacterium]